MPMACREVDHRRRLITLAPEHAHGFGQSSLVDRRRGVSHERRGSWLLLDSRGQPDGISASIVILNRLSRSRSAPTFCIDHYRKDWPMSRLFWKARPRDRRVARHRAAIALAHWPTKAPMSLYTYERVRRSGRRGCSSDRRQGRKALAIQASSADPAAVKRSVDEAARALGGLDILVNNAAIALYDSIANVSVAGASRRCWTSTCVHPCLPRRPPFPI